MIDKSILQAYCFTICENPRRDCRSTDSGFETRSFQVTDFLNVDLLGRVAIISKTANNLYKYSGIIKLPL